MTDALVIEDDVMPSGEASNRVITSPDGFICDEIINETLDGLCHRVAQISNAKRRTNQVVINSDNASVSDKNHLIHT
jgi:hypothetical protein